MHELERRRAERDAAKRKMEDVWANPTYTVTQAQWLKAHNQKVKESHTREWANVILATVEARYLRASRRLLLAEHGLDGTGEAAYITVKDQPEDLGCLILATYADVLSAVDPKQWYEGIFTASGRRTELRVAMLMPELVMSKAQRRHEEPHAGNKGVCGEVEATAEHEKQEHERLRDILYGSRKGWFEAMRRHKRPFTHAEFQETYTALLAYKLGEPLTVEQELRGMDLDALTPFEALVTLRRLKAVAQRQTDTGQFFPVSLGGSLLPARIAV